MLRSLCICLLILGFIGVTQSISTKVDFGEEEASVVKHTSKEDEDVEVKHTIVVSTKLKNNNRRGLHADGDSADLTYSIGGKKENKEDSDEVPVLKGYKALETTQIRTPDSRIKPSTYIYPEFVIQNRRDEFDLYPNYIANTPQWKPSAFYNNINSWNQGLSNYARSNRPDYQKFHRRVSDDGVREFYCRKCRELNGPRGCVESKPHSLYERTTPRIKIDGKIAKLN